MESNNNYFKNETSMISVIIPIYNREKTLENCIHSVLNTSYKNLEVILVDDGSTDNSLEICRKYECLDNRICVLMKENGGVSSARNMGIDNAHGDWVAFVDSDDMVQPEHFSIIEQADKIGADMTMCMFTHARFESGNLIVYEDGEKEVYSEYLGKDKILDYLYDGIEPYTHPNFFCYDKCFRRSLLTEYGIDFSTDVSLGEDQVFVCEYLKHANHLLYSTAKTYVRIVWSQVESGYSLGGMSRSNKDYMHNIKMNYVALRELYEVSRNHSVYRYGMNYLLDRPIRMMVMRRCRTIKEQFRNHALIKDGLKQSLVLLNEGKGHLICVRSLQIRMLDWLLLNCGTLVTMIMIRIVIDYNYVMEGLKCRLIRLQRCLRRNSCL